MTYQEDKERRRKKLKRDAIARDLHSKKYRQRVVEDKKRKKRNEGYEEEQE